MSEMRRKDREVTDVEGIREILELCKTCHVAMIDGDQPYVVPLNYGYELKDGTLTLYLHSASKGRKLDILKRNNRVCFEMCNEGEVVHAQTPCNSGYFFSSIIGNGEVVFLEDTKEKCEALSMLVKHQSGRDYEFNEAQAQAVCEYKIVSREFCGKRKRRPM